MSEEQTFNIEHFAEEKKQKYEALIQRAKGMGHNQESIMLTGPRKGLYKKIGDYYIYAEPDDSTYYVTKPKYIEERFVKSCVFLQTSLSTFSNIRMIGYLTRASKGQYPYAQHNFKSPIARFDFDDNGKLEYVYPYHDGEYLKTPEEIINEISKKQQKIDSKIDTIDKEIQKLLQEKGELEAQRQKLEASKASFVELSTASPRKVIIGLPNACSTHIEQFYAAKDFMARYK